MDKKIFSRCLCVCVWGGGGEGGGGRTEDPVRNREAHFCPLGSQSEHRIPLSLGQPD